MSAQDARGPMTMRQRPVGPRWNLAGTITVLRLERQGLGLAPSDGLRPDEARSPKSMDRRPRARIALCRTKELCPSPALQAIVVVVLPRDGREHHGKKSRRLRIIVCHT